MDNIQEFNIGALNLNSSAMERQVSAPERSAIETKDATMRHLNVVLIGDRNAGKSRVGGQILFLTEQADEPMTVINRRPVNFGGGHFKTQTTRYTILDSPVTGQSLRSGCLKHVPDMISAISQADIGMLVLSAGKGEFETGYRKGGQTREHVQLAKSLGVTKLLAVVNKMDDPEVNWSIERYQEIESKMTPVLKSSGYNVQKDVQFLPISGLHGSNLHKRVDKDVCSWWNGVL
ncbi:Transcription factor, GTP-binding domain containing protein [Heracleum sosnowskyi]|uniref:Transcription factor, GTP-binding domain containing protein n=1 Tax=Heracleum sosnowskyi TaxID=360622 RepID=A0AAD8M276_9APIA|nr:Transcription factor, GTP-binding domain containing protein [Heracleum sosnowskyi]